MIALEHFNVGDYVVNTWGWEQTNVEFYRVVKVLPKSIRVVPVSTRITEGRGDMSAMVAPSDSPIGDEILLRLKQYKNGDVAICNSKKYYHFCKWDSKPKYCSWYA